MKVKGTQFTTENKTLALKATVETSGEDRVLGKFTGTTLRWDAGGIPFDTSFSVFPSSYAIVFEQVLPDGIPDTGYKAEDFQDLMTSFPSVLMREPAAARKGDTGTGTSTGKGYLSMSGRFLEASRAGVFSTAQWPGPLPDYQVGSGGGPCVIFDASLSAARSVAGTGLSRSRAPRTSSTLHEQH